MHRMWCPADFLCAGDGAESLRSPREAELIGKRRDLHYEMTPDICRRSPSNTGLRVDQHVSIRKRPKRIRNNSDNPHTRPRVLVLPSRQTEIPQNSQRTGQSTQKVHGSAWGIVRPRLGTAWSHLANILCCLQETLLTFSSFIEK